MPQQIYTSSGARLPKSTVRRPAPPPASPASLAGLQQLANEPYVEPRQQDPFSFAATMQEPDIEPIENMFAALEGQPPVPPALTGLAAIAGRRRR